jgi:uncharacterized protein (DUF58 family)
MLALEKPSGGSATDLVAPLKRVAELVRKRGLMILVSDLFAPIDALEANLTSLCACGHEVMVFQVMDPAETSFDFSKAAMFFDVESGREIYIDPSSARSEYLRKLGEHNDAVTRTCQKLGAECVRFNTDRPLELALFDFLRARLQRGRRLAIRRNQR